jgi:phosphoserine aminotransferase
MAHRVFNFNAGPSTLPLPVLEQVQAELLDYRGTGMSILESSHRSPEYDEINERAMRVARELFGLGPDYHILFLTGGASMQFTMVPMNFLPGGGTGVYVDTGTWSSKAIQESKLLGATHVAYSGKSGSYTHIPGDDELAIPGDAAYVHITTNNTIRGTQYQRDPAVAGTLIADMSSDIASRRRDFTRYAMFYAGAQKNLGPSGVTLVAIRDDLLQRSAAAPTMLNYKTHADKKSLYNTPPAFSVYVLALVLDWLRDQGGLAAIEQRNADKKDLIYGMMDRHPDFYRGTAEPGSRSWMNLTMRLPSEELEKKFIAEAKQAGLVGIKGHRSVGGIRFSLYNAMPIEGARAAADFMTDFMARA